MGQRVSGLVAMVMALGSVIAVSGGASATDYSFARSAKGAEILLSDSDFYDRLSPADLNLRTGRSAGQATVDDLKAQFNSGVADWSMEDLAKLGPIVAEGRQRLRPYEDLLPDTIYLVKTGQAVESGVPHTRKNAIFFEPDDGFGKEVFLHEVFHVLSRNQLERRDSLYALIGFKPCDLVLGPEAAALKLTNPDTASGRDYYLPLERGGAYDGIVPFIYGASQWVDPDIPGGIFGHLRFGLMKISVDDGKCQAEDKPLEELLLNPDEVPEYFEAIGRNTDYIIHPEEVLADNFVALLLGAEGLANPEVPAALKGWLEEK